MAIPDCNTNNTGSLTKVLESIKTAGVPERVSFEFLKTLGFKSSNDRTLVAVLKGIGFLDPNGKPTETYKAYRSYDSKKVLASAIRHAYADIFLAHTAANTLPLDKIKGIIASKTTKADASVERIARTFQTLSKAADFTDNETTTPAMAADTQTSPPIAKPEQPASTGTVPSIPVKTPSFHYNIEIHLPTTTDITVYNAIFKSLRDNLL